MLDIDAIAIEFGYWATPRYETEFPRVSAGFAEMKCDARYSHKYRINPISDDLGLRIDGYLGIIRKLTPELYDVFVLTYIKRWEKQEILTYLRISKAEYFNRIKTVKTSLMLMIVSGGSECIWVV
ncbi:antiterminator Q family protein [Haemophilus haemolyticus]|uniref:antiterminator Q family protein n=1 Tax=Haemophilus haemolyticus TaxID=726 RepID=UPI00112CC72C|nr:antiterminator Q family protein [Haemophilus haemolyticus]TPH11491.1 hypothetical protein EUX49_00370 [Haemophilus haemolyticus]